MKKKAKKNDVKDMSVPRKIKKGELISMMLTIPFTFNTGESVEKITEQLDAIVTTERTKAVEAIAKLLGLKVNWEEN